MDALLLTLCFIPLPPWLLCTLPAGTLGPYFRSPPRRLSLTTPRQRRPPAHGDQVPTLHGHIAGRRFLGGQPQSHGGLDKARFHPDVRPLLPPPAAPHPAWSPGPPPAGSRLGPLPAGAPRSLLGHPPAAAPGARPPGTLPRRRFHSKTRPEGALRGAEPGPSPPSLRRPPPSAGDVRALGPRPWQAGHQSAEDAEFGGGGGERAGSEGGRRGSPEEAAIGRRKRGYLACCPFPHSGPWTPLLASLSSND